MHTHNTQVRAIVNIDGCSGDLPVIVGSGASLILTDTQTSGMNGSIIFQQWLAVPSNDPCYKDDLSILSQMIAVATVPEARQTYNF